MRFVVDTDVVAYFLLGTPKFVHEAREFWQRADELLAPSLWEAEVANVVWMAARSEIMTRPEAIAKLALASRLGIRSVSNKTLWYGALARALAENVAVYDTLFVELAAREETLLATFDPKVLKSFPAIAKRPRDLRRSS